MGEWDLSQTPGAAVAEAHWDTVDKQTTAVEQTPSAKAAEALNLLFGKDWSDTTDMDFLKKATQLGTAMQSWDQSMSAADMAAKVRAMAKESQQVKAATPTAPAV